MNIAAVILWYLVGYAGCVWAVSRHRDVTGHNLSVFTMLALGGPVFPILLLIALADTDKVVIRRRK